eukprot:CAMPEP_0119138850 /NCGR_PEP_ID=MMETSP1310-20130426/26465_1 /TAXON_ID=464262 /ORGANISM="Genus nov. species nov., Strain RCC2339" /LENGTH=117 /DNA_ID=CAMNT_0007130085 /DNA_START=44 /DNA_END=393 /DNA_ORIENTATION=+
MAGNEDTIVLVKPKRGAGHRLRRGNRKLRGKFDSNRHVDKVPERMKKLTPDWAIVLAIDIALSALRTHMKIQIRTSHLAKLRTCLEQVLLSTDIRWVAGDGGEGFYPYYEQNSIPTA